jgi:hypothetical protein
LADLCSGQRRLFWGWMWICVCVCEYLLIWCDKTSVHEITDCSSIIPKPSPNKISQVVQILLLLDEQIWLN